MGFIETKQKALAYDNAKEVARQNQVSDAELRAAMAEQQAKAHHGLGYQQALADIQGAVDPRYVAAQNAYIPQNNTNPHNIANVPGQEIPGYTIPSQGEVGPSSYKRPAVVAPQNQGLGWSKAMGDGYIQ